MSSGATREQGDSLRRARDYMGALEVYAQVLKGREDPQADVCMSVARCHLALGDRVEALRWLIRVVDTGYDFRRWQEAATLVDRLLAQMSSGDAALAIGARREVRAWLTGSYTLVQLAPMLRLAALRAGILLHLGVGDYGQFRQDAIDPRSPMYAFEPEIVLVALHHEAIALPNFADTPAEVVRSAARSVTSLWEAIRTHTRARIVCTNVAAPVEEAFGHLATRVSGSRRRLVSSVNDQLGEVAAQTGVGLVDCESLSSSFGKLRWFDDRYYHLSKQAVSFDALPILAHHMSAVVAAELGLSKKCLVLDLDNTLWGGVIGEDGLTGIQVGQGDPRSEAYLAFQRYVKALQGKGVILAVCSKNNDADAREPFLEHPEMLLRLDDFAVFVANWERKSDNLKRIADSLNVGMDALVFVDDNPSEREIVRQFAPEVDVVNLPEDPAGYVRALSDYLYFETAAFTPEDAAKTAQYRARAEIAELEQSVSSIEDFHRSLQMSAVVSPFDDMHMARIVQLVGKTNQFNLTTQRFSEAELRERMGRPRAIHYYLKLTDRFADHGLVSLILGSPCGETLEIELWLMSCRVIGRTVEAELLSHVTRAATEQGFTRLRGVYIPTAKNAMVEHVYRDFGFELVEAEPGGRTVWEYDLVAQGVVRNGFIDVSPSPRTDSTGAYV